MTSRTAIDTNRSFDERMNGQSADFFKLNARFRSMRERIEGRQTQMLNQFMNAAGIAGNPELAKMFQDTLNDEMKRHTESKTNVANAFHAQPKSTSNDTTSSTSSSTSMSTTVSIPDGTSFEDMKAEMIDNMKTLQTHLTTQFRSSIAKQLASSAQPLNAKYQELAGMTDASTAKSQAMNTVLEYSRSNVTGLMQLDAPDNSYSSNESSYAKHMGIESFVLDSMRKTAIDQSNAEVKTKLASSIVEQTWTSSSTQDSIPTREEWLDGAVINSSDLICIGQIVTDNPSLPTPCIGRYRSTVNADSSHSIQMVDSAIWTQWKGYRVVRVVSQSSQVFVLLQAAYQSSAPLLVIVSASPQVDQSLQIKSIELTRQSSQDRYAPCHMIFQPSVPCLDIFSHVKRAVTGRVQLCIERWSFDSNTFTAALAGTYWIPIAERPMFLYDALPITSSKYRCLVLFQDYPHIIDVDLLAQSVQSCVKICETLNSIPLKMVSIDTLVSYDNGDTVWRSYNQDSTISKLDTAPNVFLQSPTINGGFDPRRQVFWQRSTASMNQTRQDANIASLHTTISDTNLGTIYLGSLTNRLQRSKLDCDAWIRIVLESSEI